MKNSITYKFFLSFLIYGLIIILIIAAGLQFILPGYYKNKKIDLIQNYSDLIEENYNEQKYNEAISYLDELQEKAGGKISIISENFTSRGNSWGYRRNSLNSENLIDTEKNFMSLTGTNKTGNKIYLIALKTDEGYLTYEVSIESLTYVLDVILGFITIFLFIALFLSLIAALIISFFITKPIKALNNLANEMKMRKANRLYVTNSNDEIGTLNKSIILLYEELLSNIQKLESKLSQERKMDKLKRNFISQVTHELKTPISIIGGYCELLNDNMYKDKQEMNTYISNIYNETENINNLINNILDYSQLESGFFQVNKTKTNVKKWINKNIKKFEKYIISKNIEFIYENNIDNIEKDIDEFRMDQVINNLISNAVEYSSGKIYLKANNVDDKIIIKIQNTGKKIAKEDIPFIFTEFYKEKGKSPGSGLGLAIVKKIVDLHQGEYRVENFDDGAGFTIII